MVSWGAWPAATCLDLKKQEALKKVQSFELVLKHELAKFKFYSQKAQEKV